MRHRTKNTHGTRDARRGFTLVEVMVAMIVFAIALMGLVALQKVSITAAGSGRDHTVAANLARYAITWLQNEAAHYAKTEGDINFNDVDYPLLYGGLDANVGSYVLLDANTPTFRFDEYLGHSALEMYEDVDSAMYCIHYKLEQFQSYQVDTETATPYVPDLYKVSVRVTWPKPKSYLTEGLDWTDCSQRTAEPNLSDFNALELSGVITREFASKVH
ncbi:MAG: prepilin-type N-terminal cleavage/methylation domain-containing protein [Proteobacteria bacterium]|nr:prepilin-type N-terminal cleavage/methylation domain-containing protein [Pseudomonadota bacterium]